MKAIDYYNRGMAYAKDGGYEGNNKAIADFTEALRISDGDLDKNAIEHNLFLCYHNRGMCQTIKEKEISDYTMSLRFSLGNSGSFCNRGSSYSKINRDGYAEASDKDGLALAIADFETAIKLNPQDVDYHKRLESVKKAGGVAFRDKGTKYETIALYTDTLQNNPADADAYFKRAMAFKERGKHELALADINMAVNIKPDNEQYLKGLKEVKSAKNKQSFILTFIIVGIVVAVILLIGRACVSCLS